MMRHIASAQYWDRPVGGDTGRLFLTFGRPVCDNQISNCPLDSVLIYKNLIYFLNLQFCDKQDIDFLILYTVTAYFYITLKYLDNYVLLLTAVFL